VTRRRLWAKHMGIKRGAMGNTLGEHIGNLMGTKKKAQNPSPPLPKLKRKQVVFVPIHA